MKRDMDLVRRILMEVEKNTSPNEQMENLTIDGYLPPVVHHHVELLHKADYLVAHEAQAIGHYEWYPVCLTWNGHDFLDSIRDPEIWRKTKEGALAAGGFTFDLLSALAKGFIKQQINSKMGIDV